MEWIEKCYSARLEWQEFGNPLFQGGRNGNYSEFWNIAAQALQLFPDRTLTALECIAEDNCVILEQEWKGTLAVTAGTHQQGEISELRIVSFFELGQGLIVRQRDYLSHTPGKI